MGRILLAAAVALAAWTGTGAPPPEAPEAKPMPAPKGCVPADQCCKVCVGGRACGDSCISAKKQCNKGSGCACNASQICGSKK